MLRSIEVADFKTLNAHIALVVNRYDALSISGGEMLCVENCGFAGITSECDESITCISGDINAHQLLVNSAAHTNRAACAGGVRSILNRAPGRSFSAWVRITPGSCHVIRGVDLANCADGRQEYGKKRKDSQSSLPTENFLCGGAIDFAQYFVWKSESVQAPVVTEHAVLIEMLV